MPSSRPRPALRAFLALLSVSAFLVGCEEEPVSVVDYRLTIKPILAFNQQDLFSRLDELWLVLEKPDGNVEALQVQGARSGKSPEVTDLPVIPEGTVIHVQGYDGNRASGSLLAYGHTPPLSLGAHDEATVEVLVTAVDSYAQFQDLSSRAWGAALASAGEGNFLLFGGCTSVSSTSASKMLDSILALDTRSAEGGLAFQSIGTLPASPDRWSDGDSTPLTGRCGLAATPLTRGSHADIGRILVTGGGAPMGLGRSSWQAFLFDPADASITEIPSGMKSARTQHSAVELSNGKVVIFAGFGVGDGRHFDTQSTPEIYDPSTRTFESAQNTSPRYDVGNFGAAAALGDDSAISCGGFVTNTSLDEANHNACYIVKSDGSLRRTSPIPGVDDGESLVGAAAARIGSGRILLTGGVIATLRDNPQERVDAPALATAWIYDEGTDAWETLAASLDRPRAFHDASLLADGSVLLSGGAEEVYSLDLYQANEATSPTAIPCAEIFDPEDLEFRTVGACTGSSGPMPGAMMAMAAAADPDWGVLLAGGAQDFAGGLTPYVALYLQSPDLDI